MTINLWIIAFDASNQFFNTISTIIDIYFILDIIINFNLSFESKDGFINDWKKIFYNYFFGYFWIDLITSIPFNFFLQSSSSVSYNKLLWLAKLPKLVWTIKLAKFFSIEYIVKTFRLSNYIWY